MLIASMTSKGRNVTMLASIISLILTHCNSEACNSPSLISRLRYLDRANLRLSGGNSQSSHQLSDPIELARDEGPIRFSDDSASANIHDDERSLQETQATSNPADPDPLLKKSAAADDALASGFEELSVVPSASHRFSEVLEPAFADPLDDPSLCPAVRFFLTRCPTGKADKGIYFGSCRWHLVSLLEAAWQGQVPATPPAPSQHSASPILIPRLRSPR